MKYNDILTKVYQKSDWYRMLCLLIFRYIVLVTSNLIFGHQT